MAGYELPAVAERQAENNEPPLGGRSETPNFDSAETELGVAGLWLSYLGHGLARQWS